MFESSLNNTMAGLESVPSTRESSSSTASTTTKVETLKNDITAILNSSDGDDITKLKAARERLLKFYNNNK